MPFLSRGWTDDNDSSAWTPDRIDGGTGGRSSECIRDCGGRASQGDSGLYPTVEATETSGWQVFKENAAIVAMGIVVLIAFLLLMELAK